MEKQLLTAKEAWQYLGIGKTKFYEFVSAGLIPLFQPRPGDRRLFWRGDLDNFIQNHRQVAKASPRHLPPPSQQPQVKDPAGLSKLLKQLQIAGKTPKSNKAFE